MWGAPGLGRWWLGKEEDNIRQFAPSVLTWDDVSSGSLLACLLGDVPRPRSPALALRAILAPETLPPRRIEPLPAPSPSLHDLGDVPLSLAPRPPSRLPPPVPYPSSLSPTPLRSLPPVLRPLRVPPPPPHIVYERAIHSASPCRHAQKTA